MIGLLASALATGIFMDTKEKIGNSEFEGCIVPYLNRKKLYQTNFERLFKGLRTMAAQY